MNLTIAVPDFGVHLTVALNCQNTSQSACYRCEKHFFYNGQKFRRQCVNVIDTL